MHHWCFFIIVKISILILFTYILFGVYKVLSLNMKNKTRGIYTVKLKQNINKNYAGEG